MGTTIHNDAAADAHPYIDINKTVQVAAGTVPALANCGGRRVVVDQDTQSRFFLKVVLNIDLLPTWEVWRDNYLAVTEIDWNPVGQYRVPRSGGVCSPDVIRRSSCRPVSAPRLEWREIVLDKYVSG